MQNRVRLEIVDGQLKGKKFDFAEHDTFIFAASFVIRHSSFVIHSTFCSFPEHHQWNT